MVWMGRKDLDELNTPAGAAPAMIRHTLLLPEGPRLSSDQFAPVQG